jgi:organic radical activating enzyme
MLNQAIAARLEAVRRYSKSVRASEYHVTNACNIRCKGCWFFVHEFDKPGVKSAKETSVLAELDAFVRRELDRGVNTALLIGGEPTLFPERVAIYVQHMEHVTISSNGLRPLPRAGFEDVNVALTLFGGLRSDDGLRAIRPGGKPFQGLLDTALKNYEDDDRAIFIYAVTPAHVDEVAPTVERILANGNVLSFNYYHDYSSAQQQPGRADALLDTMLELKAKHPDRIASHPHHMTALVRGETHFGRFGYDTCPSVSVDHPDNQARLANGNRFLPKFNAWAADLETVLKCCTSGECTSCRDSQAVYTWLLVNFEHYAGSPDDIATWVDIAESYWSQFTWSPYSLYRKQQDRQPQGLEEQDRAVTQAAV